MWSIRPWVDGRGIVPESERRVPEGVTLCIEELRLELAVELVCPYQRGDIAAIVIAARIATATRTNSKGLLDLPGLNASLRAPKML